MRDLSREEIRGALLTRFVDSQYMSNLPRPSEPTSRETRSADFQLEYVDFMRKSPYWPLSAQKKAKGESMALTSPQSSFSQTNVLSFFIAQNYPAIQIDTDRKNKIVPRCAPSTCNVPSSHAKSGESTCKVKRAVKPFAKRQKPNGPT